MAKVLPDKYSFVVEIDDRAGTERIRFVCRYPDDSWNFGEENDLTPPQQAQINNIVRDAMSLKEKDVVAVARSSSIPTVMGTPISSQWTWDKVIQPVVKFVTGKKNK